ncbi:host attachment protein [Nannocystis bainbridge]|uniref:Host attachment protein n=1 Tax=Nannocystis bainbridge TaxID=2995303 RepID=A0ABT5DX29_9BACT|nr:host attachment protein [Nannocystis bainbridge]MDC0718131.1 host attachment protein [Nannocystis bainbridge]
MKPHTPTWIVLMDGSRSRILVQEAPGAALTRPFGDGFTSGRELNHEVGEDRPGRSRGSAGAARHTFEPRSNPHDKAEVEFSGQIAAFVDRGVGDRRVQRVILVAPPRALGDLRRALSPRAYARVHVEIGHDWLDLTDDEVVRRLGDALHSPLYCASPSSMAS